MTVGSIFDIQTYAVHDGPGIRTIVFLKGCPLRCAWCCNPESQRVSRDLRYHRSRCQRCGTCAKACAQGAVGSGPTFDRQVCQECDSGTCIDLCPERALCWAGEQRDASEVIEWVSRDERFFANSGGGVTFSGGEPFFQPQFLHALLEESRRRNLHTAVETCGYAPRSVVRNCTPNIDLILFDVKVVDVDRHLQATGKDNALILSNLKWLAGHCPERLVVRLPLIPRYTDDARNLTAVARLVRSLGLVRIELQPYHPFGAEKYVALGMDNPMAGEECTQQGAAVECALDLLRNNGVDCECV